MGAQLTNPGWHFADQTRTTAEIVVALFQAIRRGAGQALVIGCNTFSHLAVGIFELQRTGDDTSGLEWERTRKMGVNTLAFRMPQHNAFYACDADCVGLTTQVPWHLNRQWLELLSTSGTPLFVSPAPEALGDEQVSALRRAFALAAQAQPAGEPRDWLHLTTPCEWKLMDSPTTFDWFSPTGVE
jgi:alpha-galactosidase